MSLTAGNAAIIVFFTKALMNRGRIPQRHEFMKYSSTYKLTFFTGLVGENNVNIIAHFLNQFNVLVSLCFAMRLLQY